MDRLNRGGRATIPGYAGHQPHARDNISNSTFSTEWVPSQRKHIGKEAGQSRSASRAASPAVQERGCSAVDRPLTVAD